MSVFEDEIVRRGGRLELDKISPGLVYTYQYFLDLANDTIRHVINEFNSIGEISFVIIDNYDFKAFAMGKKGRYLIGIHRGIISTLLLVFDRLFADKDLFTEIGNPDLEDSNLPKIENFSSNYINTVASLEFFDNPKCQIRREISREFAIKAFNIVLQHEIHHILRGHIDFKNAILRNEIDIIKFTGNEFSAKNMINQTLEIDADESSVETIYRTIILDMISKMNEGIHLQKPIKMLWESIYEYTSIFTLLFKIYNDNRITEADFHSEFYPAPRLRNFITAIKLFNIKEYSLLKEAVNNNQFSIMHIQELLRSFTHMERSLEIITGKSISMDSILDVIGNVGTNQIEHIYKFWNESLLDELNKYTYVKLSAKVYLGVS